MSKLSSAQNALSDSKKELKIEIKMAPRVVPTCLKARQLLYIPKISINMPGDAHSLKCKNDGFTIS